MGARTPGYVWLVYSLGLVGAAFLVAAAVFWATVYFVSNDEGVAVGFAISPLPFILWGGLIVLAAGTWLWRRRRVGR